MSRAIHKVCPERNAPPPIRSMVSTAAYRNGWDSTFGKQDKRKTFTNSTKIEEEKPCQNRRP